MFNARKRFRKISGSKELSLLRFFISLALASIDTVWVLYMNSFGLSESTIGYISSILIVISILFTFLSTIILELFKKKRLLQFAFLTSAMGFFLVAVYNNLIFFLVFSIILILAGVVRIESFNILFRDNSTKKELNNDEGFLHVLLNIGWLVGPLIAGFFLVKYGIVSVFYVVSALFLICSLYLLLSNIKDKYKKRDKIDLNVFYNLKSFILNKKLHLPYLMAMGVEVWWTIIYIYMPLFIIKSGLTESVVALFLAIITIPLILFENKIGTLSSKYGFRFFYIIGFLGLALVSIIMFFVNNIILQLCLCIFGSFFVAFIEPLRDTYFFKQTKIIEEEKYYPIHSTSTDIGSFFGKISIATVILFLPSKFSYLLMSILMITFFMIALKIPRKSK